MSIQANIRRIKVDPASDYQTAYNKTTGGLIYIPRGRDTVLQLGYYEKDVFLANPSHIATITAEIRPYSNRGGTALVVATTSTIAAVSAEGSWLNDEDQHATLTLDAAQTASLATENETDYWLVITALTTGGKPLTLVSGRCIGVNDAGNYSATQPAAADPTYVTAAQFYSALGAINAGEFTRNGWRVRLDVDENGQVTFNATTV
jgi:hypothetical protein